MFLTFYLDNTVTLSNFWRYMNNVSYTMEKKRPLISTLLFIGIFLVGILLVVLFAGKALNDEQAVHQSTVIIPVEQLS